MRYLAWAFIGAMFAIPGRCWWLSRRGQRTVRWRVHGEEYEVERRR